MTELAYSGFVELDENELYEVDGGEGIAFGTVCLIIGGCVVVCAVGGFIGGCIYEAVFGK